MRGVGISRNSFTTVQPAALFSAVIVSQAWEHFSLGNDSLRQEDILKLLPMLGEDPSHEKYKNVGRFGAFLG